LKTKKASAQRRPNQQVHNRQRLTINSQPTNHPFHRDTTALN
jgi:hypothetical protein